jgi:hypothetical protein
VIPFNIADSSVADDRDIVNRAIGRPAGARPESLVIGRFEVGTDMPNNSQSHNFVVPCSSLRLYHNVALRTNSWGGGGERLHLRIRLGLRLSQS